MEEIAGNEISFVLAELAGVVRKALEDSRRVNLILQHPDYSKAITPPVAVVYDTNFEAEEIGFGGELGEGRDEKQLVLSGDGSTTTFKLPGDLVRPILQVRTKDVLLADIDDYTVSYDESLLSFRFPPAKHEKVYVRYMVRRDGEDKGMKIKIACNIDLLAADDIECNVMVLKTMKQMLKATDELQFKGIRILPQVKGEIILTKYGGAKEGAPPKSDIHGKRLVYMCETRFRVRKEPDFTRIKQIQIREKKDLPSGVLSAGKQIPAD